MNLDMMGPVEKTKIIIVAIKFQTWVKVHWYLYLSTISTALPSTCKVFKYFLLKVSCTCTCTESLSQVLKVLKVLEVFINTFRST